MVLDEASHLAVADCHNFDINGHQLCFLDKKKRQVLLDFLTTLLERMIRAQRGEVGYYCNLLPAASACQSANVNLKVYQTLVRCN